MYQIRKTFRFCAAHSLPIEGHKCGNIHGHNFQVEFEFQSEKLANGFVIDVSKLQLLKNEIERFDHQNLNDFFEFPTSEVLAKHFFDIAKSQSLPIHKVTIYETYSISASYYE